MSSSTAEEIRARLDHPVVDGDGHLIEYTPCVRDLLVEEAGEEMARAFDQVVDGAALLRRIPRDQQRRLGATRMPWWGLPTALTLDRATAMLPDLLYGRLDELGIDYALLYPTYGLIVTALDAAELRQACARAFNRFYAESWGGHRDRLEPVATIPMFTPQEALDALDHAVGELGLKTVCMAGVIPRPVPGAEDVRGARAVECVGHDSDFDYDPVWRRCLELGVTPAFHGTSMGWGTRSSRTSYVFNHIGNFAAAGEGACRSLVLGGAVQRFPELAFAFLEGGVAWALNLYADLLSHWEKRNRDAIGHYDPARLDRPLLEKLFAEHAPPALRERQHRLDQGLRMLSDPDEDRGHIDEFADSGLSRAEDLKRCFEQQLFFGCEADDPMNALAFDPKLAPLGARLRPVFASDIGHWDVPDMRAVLPEAWEAVEEGHLDAADFRAFVFGNAADMLRRANPSFFDGTVIEASLKG